MKQLARALFIASLSTAAASAAPTQAPVPDGVSASDWTGIRAAYEANRHAAFAVDGGFEARNPGQWWRTRFDGRGFLITPDAGDWSWGLELVGFGRAGAEQPVTGVAPANGGVALASSSVVRAIGRCGRRVEYHWDETLTEWYINDARGLEHGYTVHRRPAPKQNPDREGGAPLRPLVRVSRLPLTFAPANVKGLARTYAGILSGCTLWTGTDSWKSGCEKSRRTSGSHQPLHFTLSVRGDLTPQVSSDGRSVTFVDERGAAVVNYTGLMVYDANGSPVPAWFEDAPLPTACSLKPTAFLLVIDDSHAVYPLTIDPIAQQAYLKASNTGAQDRFGWSVAVSGDTVAVGAPFEDSNATGVNGN